MGGFFFDFAPFRTASGPSRRVREYTVASMASSRRFERAHAPRERPDLVMTIYTHRALQKWKATIYEASMPPEAIIKALQERVARQRMLKEKFETELEAIVRSRRPTSVPSTRGHLTRPWVVSFWISMLRAGASGDGAGLREPRRGQTLITHKNTDADDENKTTWRDEEVEGQDQERRQVRSEAETDHPQDDEKLLKYRLADVAVL